MSYTSVTAIDFLPADFHVGRQRRRARRGRWGVVAAFLLLTGLGLVGNRIQYAQLKAESDRLKPQAASVADLEKSLAELQQEIDHAGLHADLRSRLRLRPASTRLMAAVTQPLPEGVALLELQVRDEQPTGGIPATQSPRGEKASKPPVQSDLDRLRADQTRQIVTVRGFAPDDGTISHYLNGLRQAGVYDEVRLLFTDRYEYRGHELRTFSVRLRVRRPVSPEAAGPLPATGAAV